MKIHTLVCILVSLFAWSHAAHAETNFGEGPEATDEASRLPKISIDGNRFVDENGDTFIFRGLALPDPAVMLDRGKWDRSYFEAAKSWNANVVRVAVHPNHWRRLGETEYIKLIDQSVQWATELGMYVIIDWHSIGNPITDVYHRPMYITDRGETFRFWYSIASRYKDNTTVAIYELFNEPTNRNGRMGRLGWSEYKAYIEDMIFMVRAIDEDCIPLVGGLNFAYLLSDVRFDPISYPNIAYSSHPYPQKRPEPWIDDWERDWGFVAEKYPMICTEFGFMSADGPGAHRPVIADETYGEAIIKYFEERGISWTAWVFDPEWSPQLFSDWDYTPTAQGKLFREKLMELNK